jgi:hypothetical protein
VREQLELTAILICIALVSGAMFLFPVDKKIAEHQAFLELWWATNDSLRINKVDSTHISSMPISEATKRSLWFRRKRNWPYKSSHELLSDPYLKTDSLFFSLGTIDFSFNQTPKQQELRRGAPRQEYNYTAALKAYEPLDLNTCDSASLDELPGIGPGMAGILLDYRTKFGYIADVNHLKQTTYFGQIWKEQWDGLLVVHEVPPPKLSLSSSTFQELLDFPALNYNQVKRICFYRESFSPPTWSEIAGWDEFSEVDTTFLQLYISRN